MLSLFLCDQVQIQNRLSLSSLPFEKFTVTCRCFCLFRLPSPALHPPTHSPFPQPPQLPPLVANHYHQHHLQQHHHHYHVNQFLSFLVFLIFSSLLFFFFFLFLNNLFILCTPVFLLWRLFFQFPSFLLSPPPFFFTLHIYPLFVKFLSLIFRFLYIFIEVP